MSEVLEDLATQHRDLDALLSSLKPELWGAAVERCPGWSVADVVLHLAQTDELATSTLEGRWAGFLDPGSVDESAALSVERERSTSREALLARWRDASSTLDRVFGNKDPHLRVPWVVGTLS